ncbi:hypothetical protein GCM10010387_67400 [Streptomyces inusitatus]|uniref:Uncharacterized protein n=1 Tax=Streptomyces inusitatus TaxID=68221 RepID=A0A918QR38_9ACTN|nr:hypothetical protein [Streptomyces inusitatus]GGZ64841.1 hypothetical protein GCM10010387_67400 [Streptomyces inusitatus]
MSNPEEPATVTPRDVAELLSMSKAGPMVIVALDDVPGCIAIGPAILSVAGPVLATSGELREMLSEATADSARMWHNDYRLTYDGYVMLALLINRRCSEVINGRAVRVIRPVGEPFSGTLRRALGQDE